MNFRGLYAALLCKYLYSGRPGGMVIQLLMIGSMRERGSESCNCGLHGPSSTPRDFTAWLKNTVVK